MTYEIKPIFFGAKDEWATYRVVANGGRRVGKFHDAAEAEAYLAKLETTPRHVPGQQADHGLRTLAQESALELRLRGGKWKRKVIEEEDEVDADINLEIPF